MTHFSGKTVLYSWYQPHEGLLNFWHAHYPSSKENIKDWSRCGLGISAQSQQITDSPLQEAVMVNLVCQNDKTGIHPEDWPPAMPVGDYTMLIRL